GAAGKASGTGVVLPAPGGASSTSRGCAARLSRTCGNRVSMGKVVGITAQGYGQRVSALARRRAEPHPALRASLSRKQERGWNRASIGKHGKYEYRRPATTRRRGAGAGGRRGKCAMDGARPRLGP